MPSNLYKDRKRAKSFGEDPGLYDRYRPGYPVELIDDLMAGTPVDVVDVGCGTGIVSRLFMARGCNVLGVEADPRMADFAREQGETVEVARFEAWDPAGRTFDLLVSGQAWHWIDPLPGALAAARCIRPDGRFAVFWNLATYPEDVKAVLVEIYSKLAPEMLANSPLLSSINPSDPPRPLEDDPVVQALNATGQFHSPERRFYNWERPTTVEDWLGHVRTVSDFRQLDGALQTEIVTQLNERLLELGADFVIGSRTRMLTALKT